MGIYSIYGLYNNKLVKDFKTKAVEDYGNIIVNVSEATTPIILQLYQGDKDIKVLEERSREMVRSCLITWERELT